MQNSDVGEEVKRLVVGTLRADIELLNRAAQVGRAILKESRARPHSAADVLNRLIRFSLEYHSLLNDYSQTFVKETLDLAERTLGGTAPTSKRAAPQLAVGGHVGEVLSATFVVANSLSVSTPLSFSIGDFTSSDGEIVKVGNAVFEPAAPTLAPGEEQTVVITMPIGSQFRAGREYTAQIQVEGLGTYELQLTLRVERDAATVRRKRQPVGLGPETKS